LNTMGIPASSMTEGRKRKWCKRRYLAGVWQLAAVHYLVRRTTYKGVHFYGRKSKTLDSGLIPQPVPAIISPELWDQAHNAIRQNLQWAKRNARHDHLLRGLMRCGFCGRRFLATISTNRPPYYSCGSHLKQNRVLLGATCSSPRFPIAWIEDLVWEELKGWI